MSYITRGVLCANLVEFLLLSGAERGDAQVGSREGDFGANLTHSTLVGFMPSRITAKCFKSVKLVNVPLLNILLWHEASYADQLRFWETGVDTVPILEAFQARNTRYQEGEAHLRLICIFAWKLDPEGA